jgi:hypothetical protein
MSVSFPHLHAVGQLVVHLPKDKKLPCPYLPTHSLGRPLALARGRILILGFIWSLPKLAVYDVAHSLPLGDVGRGFSFTEDETRRNFSYLFRNRVSKPVILYNEHMLLNCKLQFTVYTTTTNTQEGRTEI